MENFNCSTKGCGYFEEESLKEETALRDEINASQKTKINKRTSI